jgi:hypothetical protein
MAPLEDLKQALIVVLGLALGLRVHLGCTEDALQLLVIQSFEVSLQPFVECFFSLLESELRS